MMIIYTLLKMLSGKFQALHQLLNLLDAGYTYYKSVRACLEDMPIILTGCQYTMERNLTIKPDVKSKRTNMTICVADMAHLQNMLVIFRY